MSFRGFIHFHQESILVAVALLFLGLLFAYVMWGIGSLTASFGQAITVERGEERGASFHFEEMQKLKLPGVQ